MGNYFSIIEKIVLESCSECGQPTKIKIVHEGTQRETIMPARCACVERIRRQEELKALEKGRQQQQQKQDQDNRRNCFNDPRTRGATFAADRRPNSELSKAARKFAKQFHKIRMTGRGLLFYGDPGVGKSFLAGCICNDLIEQGFKCLFTSIAEIIDVIDLEFAGKQERLKRYAKYDLIVIDDLWIRNLTSYRQDKTFEIIDFLYRSKVPVIITTNIDLPKMIGSKSDLFGLRLYGRLNQMCLPIKIDGQDMRNKK